MDFFFIPEKKRGICQLCAECDQVPFFFKCFWSIVDTNNKQRVNFIPFENI
jgi:hypothetical protein